MGADYACIIDIMHFSKRYRAARARLGRMAGLVILLLAAGCQGGIPIMPTPSLVWPLPPERPRVKFVDMILGSVDVRTDPNSGRIRSFLFGEERDVRFFKPYFVTARGNVMYVTDIGMVHVYDFDEEEYRTIGSGVLHNPTGLALAPDGTLYVGDSGLRRVVVFAPSGKVVRSFGDEELFGSIGGLAYDPARERLYVVDSKFHDIKVFSPDGRLIEVMGTRGGGPVEFNFPYDVALDPDGTLFVVDSNNFRIQVISPEGKLIGKFGGLGDQPGTFSRPKGIALDSEGHIYVVDGAFGNFQIFSRDGVVLMPVGTLGGVPGQFILPVGIHIDENDRIYVVDQLNARVQIFQYLKYPDE